MIPLSKSNAKFIRSLHLKKYRDKFNNFIAEGTKICLEILTNPSAKVEYCVATKDWYAQFSSYLTQSDLPLLEASTQEMKNITTQSTPPPVLMVVKQIPFTLSGDQMKGWSLYLDGIQDPGNMGTILRIADWFHLDAVISSRDSVDLYGSKTIQSSMGAFLRVPHLRMALSDFIKEMDWKAPVFGAFMDGENAFQQNYPQQGLLVIGNEGNGIREHVLPAIGKKISIPKGGNSGAESLNAGVATGILCATILNQLNMFA